MFGITSMILRISADSASSFCSVSASSLGHFRDLFFDFFRFFLLAFRHQPADLLADLVALAAQIVRALFCFAVSGVFFDHFIHERKLVILKFFADIFLYQSGFSRRKRMSNIILIPFLSVTVVQQLQQPVGQFP